LEEADVALLLPCCAEDVVDGVRHSPGVVDLYVVAAAGDDDVPGVRHQHGEGVLASTRSLM